MQSGDSSAKPTPVFAQANFACFTTGPLSIRRNSGFCDRCRTRICARLQRKMAGASSSVWAGGRLNFTTTQVRVPLLRLRGNVEGRGRDRAVTQAALYADCLDRFGPGAGE